MSKGLEALKTIRHIHDMECGEDESINKDFDIIEKELKALYLIRKLGLTEIVYIMCVNYDAYVENRNNPIPKEEFDLLEEVLS